jgi:hypothetical protein
MIPPWLHDLALLSLGLGGASALVLGVDLARRPQRMWIMDVVWPVTALFGGPLVLWQYFVHGRARPGETEPLTPFWAAVANGALHCGAGCALGDLMAEWLVFAVPAVAVAFGWPRLFRDQIFAVWIVDYLFAYAFGIAFQYFTIAPMRGLSLGPGLWAAIKADTLSLTAWQVGMYGSMAIAHFLLFGRIFGVALKTDTAEFWFVMQIAMLCGFVTAYPVNWWLIRAGVKETM